MRREFSAKTKVEAFKRAGGQCEACGLYLMPGKVEYDHRIPDALGGEPTLENCMAVCTACHSEKTRTRDVPDISKAKRREAKHLGAKVSRNPLPAGKRSPWRKKLNGEVVPR